MLCWETWSKGAEKGGTASCPQGAYSLSHGLAAQRMAYTERPAAEFSVLDHKSSSKVKKFTTKLMPCDYKSSCK